MARADGTRRPLGAQDVQGNPRYVVAVFRAQKCIHTFIKREVVAKAGIEQGRGSCGRVRYGSLRTNTSSH